MPDLPLTDGNGALRDDAPLWLLAILHFPRSPERQQEFYAASWAAAIASREIKPERTSLDPEALELLADAVPFEQQLKNFRNRFFRGLLVGEVLAYICCQAQNDPASASRNKAQHLQRMNLNAAAKEDPDLGFPISERTQHDSWKELSPAAHLWAALFLLSCEGSDGHDHLKLGRLRLKHDDIPRLLGHAEFFRKIGEALVPKGQRPTAKSPSSSVLDPEDTWKCPKDLEVPEVELDLSFDDALSGLFDQYNYPRLYGIK